MALPKQAYQELNRVWTIARKTVPGGGRARYSLLSEPRPTPASDSFPRPAQTRRDHRSQLQPQPKSLFSKLMGKTPREQATILIDTAKKDPAALKAFNRWDILKWGGADLKNLPGLNMLPLNKIGLSGTDLSGHDLSNVNLSGGNISYAKLAGTNLSGANLAETNMNFVKATGAGLANADLSGAQAANADLSKTHVTDTNMTRIQGRGMTLDGAHGSRVIMADIEAPNASIRGGNFSDSVLSGNLANTKMGATTLTNSNVDPKSLAQVADGARPRVEQGSILMTAADTPTPPEAKDTSTRSLKPNALEIAMLKDVTPPRPALQARPRPQMAPSPV